MFLQFYDISYLYGFTSISMYFFYREKIKYVPRIIFSIFIYFCKLNFKYKYGTGSFS